MHHVRCITLAGVGANKQGTLFEAEGGFDVKRLAVVRARQHGQISRDRPAIQPSKQIIDIIHVVMQDFPICHFAGPIPAPLAHSQVYTTFFQPV